MPIIRSVQSPNYTLINNCVFDDGNQLSFGAIGFLCYLLSMPFYDKKFSIQEDALLQELAAARYVILDIYGELNVFDEPQDIGE